MNQKLKGGIFVFLGACSFGVLSTIVKIAYGEGYKVGEVTGTQSMFGMILLWFMYFISTKLPVNSQKENNPETITKTPWWKIVFAGTFTGLVGIFYYQCVNYLPASIAIILLMQYLWISILIEAVVFKKMPTKIQIIAACIVFVGTVFAGGLLNESFELNIKGVCFGFLAAFSFSIFLMTSGRIGNELPPLKKSALMVTGGVLITWIIFPPLFLINGILIGGLYKWGFLLALLGAAIPPLFFSIGTPKVGMSLAAILSAAELPVAVMSSYFILKENVSGLQWLGVFLILSAIVLSNFKFKKNLSQNHY